MNFDYRFGTEATFHDWVNEGIAKAEAMLDIADSAKTEELPNEERENN